MNRKDRERDQESSPKEAKRTARHGVAPEAQPAEFNDDMRVNRFSPPPDPPKKLRKKRD